MAATQNGINGARRRVERNGGVTAYHNHVSGVGISASSRSYRHRRNGNNNIVIA